MSKDMDSDFRERMVLAAKHAKVPFTPQSLGTFLGVDRRKAAVWMSGSLPRADKLFDLADRFGVDARWFATGNGDIVAAPPAAEGLDPIEEQMLSQFRRADPRWQLSVRLLCGLAVEDQLIAATDVNVVVARIFGMKPKDLRYPSDKEVEQKLGLPPTAAARKAKEKPK